jgi:hypothetical protein
MKRASARKPARRGISGWNLARRRLSVLCFGDRRLAASRCSRLALAGLACPAPRAPFTQHRHAPAHLRQALCVAVIAAAAAAIAVTQAVPVAAMSSVRLALAGNLNELARSCNVYRPDQVWTTFRAEFSQAGVSTAGWSAAGDIATSSRKVSDVTAPEQDGGPAAGDVALFTPYTRYAPVAMAVFVNNGDVVVWNLFTGHFENVPLAGLDNASTQSATAPFAEKGSVSVYRIAQARWPGGHDDTTVAPGKIELVTAAEMNKQMAWVTSHPRDPDQSLWHGIWTGITGVPAWISGVLGAAAGLVLNTAGWLLHHIPIVGPAVLIVIGVLTKRFDASFFNHVLTLTVGAPLLAGLTLLRWGAGAVGLRGVAGVLGTMHQAAFNGLSFGVAVLTGLQGDGESSIGGVLIALVSDYAFIFKPLGIGAKAAGLYADAGARSAFVAAAGDRLASLRAILPADTLVAPVKTAAAAWGKAAVLGRYGLVAGMTKANDLIMLRPSVVARALAVTARESTMRIADMVSWVWRPQAMIVEGADQAHALAEVIGGGASGVKDVAEKAGPLLQRTGELLHSWSAGSHLSHLAATGQMQTVPPPPGLRPSELLRLKNPAATL